MIRKLVLILVAVAINCIVLAALNGVGAAAVASSTHAAADTITTLPTMVVRPSQAQLDTLRKAAHPAPSTTSAVGGGIGAHTLTMPYYSFAWEAPLDAAG